MTKIKDTRDKPTLRAEGFGLCFWWMWFLCFFFPQPFAIRSSATAETSMYRIVLMAAFIGVSILVLVLRKRLLPLFKRGWLMPSSCILTVAGTALACWGMLSGASMMFVYVGVTLGGIAHGFSSIVWIEAYGDDDLERSALYLSGSVAFGGVLYLLVLVVGQLSVYVVWLLLAIAPCFLVACFFRYSSATRSESANRPLLSEHALPTHVTGYFIAYAVVYGVLYGLMLSLALTDYSSQSDVLPLNICSMAALIAAGLILLASNFRARPDYKIALRLTLALVAVGFIVIAVTGTHFPYVASFITVLGYIIFWSLFNMVWIEIAQRSGMSTTIIVCWGLGTSAASILVGVVLYQNVLMPFSLEPAAIPLLSLAVVSVLLLMSMVLMSPRILETLGGMVTAPVKVHGSDALDGQLGLVAQRFHLTPREAEIADMLARGRNPQYIGDKLVISVNTVRTHVRSIYEKCGVHSHQEFIDLVESVKTD